nr:hypothetical protein Iba_scaffold3831CG0730 [Ipomoea batatas]
MSSSKHIRGTVPFISPRTIKDHSSHGTLNRVLATKQIEMTTTKNSTSKTKGFRVFFGHGREWLPQLVYGIKGMPRYLTISVSLDYVYPFFSNFKFLSKKSGEKRGLGSIFVAQWFLSCRMNRRFDSWLKTKLCPRHIPFSTSNCFEPSIYSTETSCCVNLKDDMTGQSISQSLFPHSTASICDYFMKTSTFTMTHETGSKQNQQDR